MSPSTYGGAVLMLLRGSGQDKSAGAVLACFGPVTAAGVHFGLNRSHREHHNEFLIAVLLTRL